MHHPLVSADPATVAASTFERFAAAWNAADGAALGELFADDTDFVDIRGEHHRGDGTFVGRGHQALFDTIYAGSTLEVVVDVARLVAPGVLVAVATTTLDAPNSPPLGADHSRI